MKKIVVLVSGGGTNLQALIDAKDVIVSGEITKVISSKPDVYALERAKNAGIPGVVVARKSFPDNESYQKALLAELKAENPDLIVLAGFLSIIGEEIIKEFPEKIINVHPSLIPSFCGDGFYGLKVHEAALEKGVKVTGATVHFVNEITDGGRIILQQPVMVEDGDTPEVLQKRVMEQAEWKILPQACEMVLSGRV
ncbi:MAG: phosphoribosylglycinamide formyltransferase [Clostridia bacterium]|nr:phosphoribosylglycinamide formyltransferase [Clostridia bacterium]